MRAALIVNPKSSKVTPDRIDAVVAALGGVEVVPTPAPGAAVDLARSLSGEVDRLYVFSGDGVFNEVLNGIDGITPVGFVPGGGTSVLPRALGLPRDPVEAARRLVHGRPRTIALGRANGRRFGFSAGIGVDAELVRRVDALGRRPDGRRPGDRAFVREGLRLLAGHRFRFDPILELRGIGPAALVLAANCSPYTYAGAIGLRFAPDARFEGGLDIVAPERIRPFELPLVAWWAFGRGARHIRAHDARHVEVVAAKPVPLQLDGEDLGDVTEVLLESEPEAVTVLV